MKAFTLVIALAALPACGKHNDVATLREEAVEMAQFYQPKVDELQQRVDAIFARGKSIPGNLPGIEDVGRRLQEARDTLQKLRGVIGKTPDPKDPRPAVEKQADEAAKAGKVADLRKLVHDTEELINNSLTVVNDDLDSVEAWIANYDRKTLALMAPPAAGSAAEPGTPETQPAPAPAPAQPEAPKQ
jgi:hypothetical protein